MIDELRVRELGVIADLTVRLSAGLTVITGETGTGKTLIVEALELAVGGRADPAMVRAGASEAQIEVRFRDGEEEWIVARTIPATGRSRASVNDNMAPIARLEEIGRAFLDLHGQHAHQSLLSPATQREALDHFAGIDLEPLRQLRRAIAALDDERARLGGDDAMRARELDFLRFELEEILEAGIEDPGEDDALREQEATLAAAAALRDRSNEAYDRLVGGASDVGVLESLGAALESLQGHTPLHEYATRLRGAISELEDLARELRLASERFEEDPALLATVQERRAVLARLVRKHGSELADVIAARDAATRRITELEASSERLEALEAERQVLADELARAEQAVGDARRDAAKLLGPAVQDKFSALALSKARFVVEVGPGIGDDVEFLLAANPGEPAHPLAKVASGGELARVMLALRLVLTEAPETLVFDEVDAGIGGETALAVARSLAALARQHQVLVVTHLPQVAAFADQHLVVEKDEHAGRTVSRLRDVRDEDRVVELSRMLSGHPDSPTAREHAAELLSMSARR